MAAIDTRVADRNDDSLRVRELRVEPPDRAQAPLTVVPRIGGRGGRGPPRRHRLGERDRRRRLDPSQQLRRDVVPEGAAVVPGVGDVELAAGDVRERDRLLVGDRRGDTDRRHREDETG